MTTKRLLWAGLITGAMAFGAGCRTDQTASRPPPPASPTDQNIGGSGEVTPRTRSEGMTPMPQDENTRGMDPQIHENPTSPPPATGGSGLEPQSLDQTDRLAPETNHEAQPTTDSVPAPVH